jgi:hypothetical protein
MIRCCLPCLAVACLLLAFGCGEESAVETPSVVVPPPEDAVPADPMSIIPEDIVLWEAFDAKRILKQPETNTLVVEGVVPGVASDLALALETTAKESGWTPETLAKNEGLSTLIMSKGARRLKVNLTQDGDSTSVYLTTRLPE